MNIYTIMLQGSVYYSSLSLHPSVMSLFSHIAANSVAEVEGPPTGKHVFLPFEDVKDGVPFVGANQKMRTGH